MPISRRQTVIGGLAALATTTSAIPAPNKTIGTDLAAKLPRWRGFNLGDKYISFADGPFRKWDFQFSADHGFDYFRLPMDYRIWTISGGGWRQKPLKDIDRAITYGEKYSIHITLCLHHAPGYCVNYPDPDYDLWVDQSARQAFAEQWRMFAARYKGIPSERLSFNLVNEPPDISEEAYAKVIRLAVEAIRSEDPDRLIIADGRNYGRKPTFCLADLHIAQATRGYEPFHLTHYHAPWVRGAMKWALPTWPYDDGITRIDADALWREQILPWKKLEELGVGVIVGEWGAYRMTPHPVVLAWMKDCLDNWRKAGWGWSLWNLRGDFGPIDSSRWDVNYNKIKGNSVDEEMMNLLIKG